MPKYRRLRVERDDEPRIPGSQFPLLIVRIAQSTLQKILGADIVFLSSGIGKYGKQISFRHGKISCTIQVKLSERVQAIDWVVEKEGRAIRGRNSCGELKETIATIATHFGVDEQVLLTTLAKF